MSNVRYRDPKPGDILYGTDGEPVLVSDFNENRIIAYYLQQPNTGPRWVYIKYDLSMRIPEYIGQAQIAKEPEATWSSIWEEFRRELCLLAMILLLFFAVCYYVFIPISL